MSFQFTQTTPAKPRRVTLALPEDLAAWAESQAGASGTLEAVVVQAVEFCRASQRRTRNRHRAAHQEA